MKYTKFLSLMMIFSLAVLFSSCSDDDDNNSNTPDLSGKSVTVRNTLQADVDTLPETAYPVLFGLSEDALDETATVSGSVEFADYLAVDGVVTGLYDIDLGSNTIDFTFLPTQGSDPFWDDNFRVIEAGTTDRYYFTFNSAHGVTDFTSNNSSVNLRIDSDNVLVVEIGEGYSFNPGTKFSITLN